MNGLRSDLGEFNIARLGWLLADQLRPWAAPLGIAAALVAGINLISFCLPPHGMLFNMSLAGLPSYQGWLWPTAAYAGCLWVATSAFRPLHAGRTGSDWLLAPATVLEKYLAAFAANLLLLPALIFGGCVGLSAALALLQQTATGSAGVVWVPGRRFDTAIVWQGWCILNLFFFAGAAAFRRFALPKTLGVMLALFLVLGGLQTALAWLIAGGDFGKEFGFKIGLGFGESGASLGSVHGRPVPAWFTNGHGMLWSIFVNLLTPLFAVAYGYARLREKEADHAD